MNVQDILFESFQKKIRDLEERASDLSWFPELPDGYKYDVFPMAGSTYIRISAPFDRHLINEMKECLLGQGWSIEIEKNENQCGDWYPYIWLKRKDGDTWHFIDVVFFDFNEGSVCKRKMIGSRTIEKEEYVYEFACE